MTIPGLSYVMVTGTFLNVRTALPSTGSVRFSLSGRWVNQTTNAIITPGDTSAVLDTNGHFTVTIPATDDPDFLPVDRYWTVTEFIDGATRTYAILLPASPAIQDLADIAPIDPTDPAAVYTLADTALISSEFLSTNGIVSGVEASAALTALDATPNSTGRLLVRNGEILYVNTVLTTSNVLVDVRPGGAIRIGPAGVYSPRIANPNQRTIIDSTIQTLTVTATGGTFLFHGGSSSTTTGASTAAINVSGLTAGGLQTAIRTLTGFGSVSVTGTGPYTITFANGLTNLNLDSSLATGGTVALNRGTFVPTNQDPWCPVWWGQVNTNDDTATMLAVQAAVNAGASTDPFTGEPAGRRIRLPYGLSKWIGVTLDACLIEGERGSTLVCPPAWATTGTVLTLNTYCAVDGGYWHTNGFLQAVTLIQTAGQRCALRNLILANRARNSIGAALGIFGASGSTSPEAHHIRGDGDQQRRIITVTATGGTIALRGGAQTSTPTTATPINVSGLTAAKLQTSLRTLPGYSTVAVSDSTALYGAGTFTALLVALGYLDIDATLATGGTVTCEAVGTCIQVNSPDFKGEDISPGGFQKGIEANNGGGRLHKFHPFSCDYGIVNQLDGWTIENPYWDTCNIWGLDAPNVDGISVSSVASNHSGFALGGGGMRFQKVGVHSCSDVSVKGGVMEDDYNTMILIDGVDGADVDLTMRSRAVQQLGLSPKATYGVHITSASTGTSVKAHARTSNFLTAPVLDEGVNSNITLGEIGPIYMPSDVVVNNSATYASLGVSFVAQQGEKWKVKIVHSAKMAVTGVGCKVRLVGAAGVTGLIRGIGCLNSSAASATAASLVTADNYVPVAAPTGVFCGLPIANTPYAFSQEGIVDCTGATGATTFSLQGTQGTASANDTTFIAADTYLIATRIK